MLKKIWDVYKIQLLVSATLAIAIIALHVLKAYDAIAATVFGALLGTFLLDADYFIYAYFTDPEKSFSQSLKAFIEHRDLKGALDQIYYHKDEVKDKTLNSVLFQAVLAGASLFVLSATNGFLIKSFVLSAFANSIYRLFDTYYAGKTGEWFWAMKNPPSKNGVFIYGFLLLAVLAYSITLT